MLFSCLRIEAAGRLFWLAFLLMAATPATAQTVACSLGNASAARTADAVTLAITLDCNGGDAKLMPGREYLLGLSLFTVKNDSENAEDKQNTINERVAEAQALKQAGAGRTTVVVRFKARYYDRDDEQKLTYSAYQKPCASGRCERWIYTDDGDADTLDIAPKVIKPAQQGARQAITFSVPTAKLKAQTHFVFALWPATQRKSCDRQSEWARPGCKELGFAHR